MKFNKEEIKALKEITQERIESNKLLCDEDGKRYPYRNRYSLESPNLLEKK